ncbi:hypothetical protein V6N11_024569 [Hibiscus sabdariffa]|uniref:DNA-directed RNA polymerase n=1 Tax=Hibiscus sabdariffa TaxID=183260 RepID=A0ABR2QMI6_9ROSI
MRSHGGSRIMTQSSSGKSISAKVEVYEPFSVEKQLLSSHSGNLHWQLATDSLLSLRVMLQTSLFRKADAQQLCMLLSSALPQPAFLKGNHVAPCWTAFQIIQTAFPACLDCSSNRSTYNELVKLRMENHIRLAKEPIADFILKSPVLGNLIDSRNDSAVNKVVQQIGFLGMQL